MFDRINSAAVAVVLGFLVWLYARSRDQESLDNVLIPVHVELTPSQADHYDLEVTGPPHVVASFSGPPSRMKELRGLLQRGELRVRTTLTVPTDRQEEARYLDTVRIDSADIHPPPGVRPVVAEDRNRVPVTLRRMVERRLPVRFEHALEDRLQQAIVEPDTVLVRGPQDVLDRIRALPTEPYTRPAPADGGALEASKASATMSIVHEIEGRPIKTSPPAVAVQMTFRPRQKEYQVDVPVQFLCPPSFPYRPKWEDERAGKITLRVVGPAGLEPPTVVAFIDLTGKKYDQGFYADEPFRLQLPKEFQLAQSPPRSGAFRLVPVTERAEGTGGGGVRTP